MYKVLYALFAWRCFLTQTQKGMICAFLRKMYKYHFVSECFGFNAIMDDMDKKCFKLICSLSASFIATCQKQPIQASLQRP